MYYQNANNQTVVTIMITMVGVEFIFIITYHMITYVCGGLIGNIQLSVDTLTPDYTTINSFSFKIT